MAGEITLQISDPEFLAFCAALAHEREAAGAGPRSRIGLGQRADALLVLAALNSHNGWGFDRHTPGSLAAEPAFALNLAPILCETPAMQAALWRVLARDGVPGRFVPEVPRLPATTPPDNVPLPAAARPDRLAVVRTLARSELLRLLDRLNDLVARIGWARLIAVTAVLCVVFLSAPLLRNGLADACKPAPPAAPNALCRYLAFQLTTGVVEVAEGVIPQAASTGTGAAGVLEAPASVASLGPLHRMLTLLEGTNFDRTPAQLAEFLALSSPSGLDPGIYLGAMLERWPIAPDRAVPRSRIGALSLANFGIAAAELEGDTGASALIRSRLVGIAEPTQGGWLRLEDDTVLPDAPQSSEEAALSLAALAAVDPRLARIAVDPIVEVVWLLTPQELAGPNGSLMGEPNPGQVELRKLIDSNVLARMGETLELRFGVSPSIDPEGSDPVTLDGIVAAIRAGLHAGAPLDSSFQIAPTPWRRELDFSVATPAVLAVLWAILGFRRALRRRLETWPKDPPPELHLVVPAPELHPPPMVRAARRLAAGLRYTPPRVTGSLAVEATVDRTLRQGGAFTPVMRARRDAASHVVLIHRRSMAEHEPRRIAALFGQLEAAGVGLQLFEYAADPGRLRSFGRLGAAVRDLDSLWQEHPGARLILVTAGDEFTGTGAHAVASSRVTALKRWKRRAIVTPVPVVDWGLREWALSQRLGAVLARAEPDGLPDLGAIFLPARGQSQAAPIAPVPQPSPTLAASWLKEARRAALTRGDQPAMPRVLNLSEAEAALPHGAEPQRIEAMVIALRRWLGPQGYLWLQACASYPVLRYPLTRWLGNRLFGETLPLRSLAQLSRLAWFAVGRIPGPIALRLREDMEPGEVARIEGMFTEFFALHGVEGPSPAQDAGRRYGDDRIAYEPDPLAASIPGARQLPARLLGAETAKTRMARARQAVLADRVAVVVAALLLAAGLWLGWPDRTALPLPPGAWVPVAAIGALWLVLSGAVALGLAVWRRSRRVLQDRPDRADRRQGWGAPGRPERTEPPEPSDQPGSSKDGPSPRREAAK